MKVVYIILLYTMMVRGFGDPVPRTKIGFGPHGTKVVIIREPVITLPYLILPYLTNVILPFVSTIL